MARTTVVGRIVPGLVALLVSGMPSVAQEFPKMDGSWTVTVNGQSVQVNPDGSFTIPNVSAPDQFGPGGPGTAPDFVSDELLRVIGVSTQNGVTRYAYSERFRFRAGQQFSVGEMTITNTAPPFPQSITAAPDDPILTSVGQQTLIQVTGKLLDGSSLNVTGSASGTTYLTSNPNVLTVGNDGVASAVGEGRAFVTARNEGATAVVSVLVALGDPLTEVIGFVHLEDGTAVSGASVSIVGQPLSTMTQPDGRFSIQNAASTLGDIQVTASAIVGGQNYSGSSEAVPAVGGGLTDAGIVTIEQVTDVTITFDLAGLPISAPASYMEAGLNVTSLQNHLHMGDTNSDGSPDLYNHSGCCSTPYVFDMGGASFSVISVDVVPGLGPSGTNTFTSSSGAIMNFATVGTFTFPSQGWQSITSFQWGTTGRMIIDNLVIAPE